MTLLEAVKGLDRLDEFNVIYAVEPFTESSEVRLVFQSDEELHNHSPVKVSPGYAYFLEVFTAREVLEDWRANVPYEPTDEEKCKKLIQYAINDALSMGEE